MIAIIYASNSASMYLGWFMITISLFAGIIYIFWWIATKADTMIGKRWEE